ncbi:ABC transporter substrate-binding protein [Ramlibacter sp.]|jgi:branched-chain amino acid transport system substrate-binding protein|uniref:ABC transporter substrate-binding protein n=1 Tax=Ramlibacter sp. TaxID=1917967 RepID=UPI00261E8DDF|nr:ABC transporter substrate-binding protein [Ramlibacter sp.]MDB5957864.1 transporter periplasmic substrate binding protein [Ramlibacter sp.]
MKKHLSLTAVALAVAAAFVAPAAMAAANEVVIGDIDDMSGPYADVIGQGGVEAAKMAIADFGGSVLGKKVVLMSADHQNKPDLAASKFREWADQNGVNMILGGSNTGTSIAMSKVAGAKHVPFIAIGAAGASLTNEDCTPYSVHYAYDTTSLANGTASVMTKEGGKTWYFLTADYAFGTQLREAATTVAQANGGKSLGEVRVPLGTTDFSSFLLQAQGSKAQVLGLANAGTDFTNSLKAAQEFGITKTMKPAALLAFISDIHSLGLKTAQGLYFTTSWYWDMNADSRAWAKRFFAVAKKEPTENQAAYYSATLQYLNAVKAANTTDPDKVMAELKKMKINDMFAKNGTIRSDGVMIHPMYVMQVKTPAESKYPWDYYKLVKTMSGEEAFGPVTGKCKAVKG